MDLYQQVFRSTYQFTGILDTEGRLLDANDAALKFIMKQKDDVVGRFFWDTEWWSHDSVLRETLKQAITQLKIEKIPHRFEVTHPRHDEKISTFDFSISPLLDDGGNIQYIIAEGRDISKIKEAERDREVSEIKYRDLFINSADAYLIIEGDKFIEFNPATVKMLGYRSEDDLLGIHPSKLSPEYQPDGSLSFEKADKMMQYAYARGSNRFEWMHRKADGTVFPVEVLLTSIRQGERAILFTVWRDISEQKRNEAEIIRMNQDLEQRIAERTKDLYESLNELKKAQHTLVESKKLAALGQLIIGISHELNTPLGTAITGVSYLSNLIKEVKNEVEIHTDVECSRVLENIDDILELTNQINRSLEHAANLVNHFKSLSVLPLDDSLADVKLYEVIEMAASPFKEEILRQNHHLEIRIPVDYFIQTHTLTLSNIFTQLISNALFHGFEEKQAGEIVIEFKEEDEWIQLILTDNGKGLMQDELDHIFDPFYTTQRGNGKSGLGMNIVYNQVNQILHGRIAVQNNPSMSGCQIVLTLPRAQTISK